MLLRNVIPVLAAIHLVISAPASMSAIQTTKHNDRPAKHLRFGWHGTSRSLKSKSFDSHSISSFTKRQTERRKIHRREVFRNAIVTDSIGVVSQSDLDALPLICPYGIQTGDKAKNILFIHGTGAIGEKTWKGGFPDAFHHKGYSSCWVNLPGASLGDAQLTGEYVAGSISKLYTYSGNIPIFIIAHSQGNLNVQWALNFFPSLRSKVSSFVALAADFQGTEMGPIAVASDGLLRGGSAPSILQQSVTFGTTTKFLEALHKHGNMALVPTTSTYGLQDQVLFPPHQATDLPINGAPFTHVSIQEICPVMFTDHFCIVVNKVAFYLALNAFENRSSANIERVKSKTKDLCFGNPLAPMMRLTGLYDNAIKPMTLSLNSLLTPSVDKETIRINEEPELLPYAINQP